MFPPDASIHRHPIVLVHGAWAGEWCWLPVLEPLRSSGRSVFCPSLTGHGSKIHLGGPEVNLSAHVSDVVGVVTTYDLHDVTLVGHSYGGRVITRVASVIADRVSSMVFVDAHTPIAPDSGIPQEWTEAASDTGMFPMLGYDFPPSLVGGDEGVAWIEARLAFQSLASFTEPWQIDLPDSARKTFVHATLNTPSRFTPYAKAAKARPDWNYHEIDGHHYLMFSHPKDLAEILLSA